VCIHDVDPGGADVIELLAVDDVQASGPPKRVICTARLQVWLEAHVIAPAIAATELYGYR
jgi:hypothetical protein